MTPFSLLLVATLFAGDSTAQGTDTKPAGKPRVALDTSMGRIVLELEADKAPKTVANFLTYVKSGHYDGTVFHRVIPNFMVQGGGMSADMKEKTTQAPVQNEADNGLKNDRGTVAMARTSDPHSATAQFFVNTVDNAFLNHKGKNPQGWGYAVFGRVVEGMDVVDKIAAVKTGNRGPHQNVPVEPVTITKATAL
jgi:peptidyl-prolyl cis-trans isomerase B (cyclophilin B)